MWNSLPVLLTFSWLYSPLRTLVTFTTYPSASLLFAYYLHLFIFLSHKSFSTSAVWYKLTNISEESSALVLLVASVTLWPWRRRPSLLRIVGKLLPKYTASHPRKPLHGPLCENLKSYKSP
jgi:hypothetical protein